MFILNKNLLPGICFVLFFSSCTWSDSFYTDYSREDLYRLPLIKPYELLNLYGADPRELGFYSWTLKLVYNNFDEYVDQLNVSKIQVSNGVIYGHGHEALEAPPNDWFVIIPEQKFEKLFKKKEEWIAFLKQKNIVPKTYKVWPVFEQYKKDGTLPWYKQ